MPALGPVVLGAIAVFLLVLVSLVVQGKRQARARKAQRSDLGLQRVAIPDPVLTAGILSAFPADDGELSLAVLERVSTTEPGTWYVAMVKRAGRAGGIDPGDRAADADPAGTAAEPATTWTRVLLVIDGLPGGGRSTDPAPIAGTDGLWTRRWASGLLLVEGAPDAGDAVRDFDAMKAAGTRAVVQATAQ